MNISQAIEEGKKPAEQRIANQMSAKAGETVTAEIVGGALYFFCQSELGALRIAYQYRHNGPDKVRAGYIENLKCWYASVEIGNLN